MNIRLEPVLIKDKAILRNLLEKYNYEFSQYDMRDINNRGLYGYYDLKSYWARENHWAYFIMVNEKLAGFVMVNNHPVVRETVTDFQIYEFFVLYKYRRLGVGKQAVMQILDKHKGRWQLRCHPKNISSVRFWDNVINEYTKGQYELIKSHPNTEYADGKLSNVFFFDS